MAPRQPLSGLLIVRKGWPQRAWRAGGSMEKPITADFTYWIGCVQRFGPHIGGGECLVDLDASTLSRLSFVRCESLDELGCGAHSDAESEGEEVCKIAQPLVCVRWRELNRHVNEYRRNAYAHQEERLMV
jgi:hypothetical protein